MSICSVFSRVCYACESYVYFNAIRPEVGELLQDTQAYDGFIMAAGKRLLFEQTCY